MTPNDLKNDLSLLKDCEFIRYEKNDDVLSIQLVMDNEEEEHHEEEEEQEDHDCCMEGLNGRLFLLEFHGVSDVVVIGEECDNYVLLSLDWKENHLSLSYEGRNLFEPDSKFSLSFSYQEYCVIDQGKIESPEV